MARPRNEEQFARVTAAAFRQFHERGYVKATYASIAKEAHCAPTIVQDYYARKDLLAQAFFNALIGRIREACRDWGAKSERPQPDMHSFAERFRDGVVYYEYLQSRCRQFLIDITADVVISNSVLLEMARWAFTDTGRADVMNDPASIERIVKSLGGYHALLNYQLSAGKPFDSQRQFTWLAYEWLDILGYNREETFALVQPGFLGTPELEEIIELVFLEFAEAYGMR